MTAEDKFKFIEYLEKLYPGKFTDGELQDFAERVSGNSLQRCVAAIDSHRNESRFKPHPADILLLLRHAKYREAEPKLKPQPSFAEIVRSQWRTAGFNVDGMDDLETLLRYFRALWLRFRADSTRRVTGATPEVQKQADEHIEHRRAGFVRQAMYAIRMLAIDPSGRAIGEPRIKNLAELILIHDEPVFQSELAQWRATLGAVASAA